MVKKNKKELDDLTKKAEEIKQKIVEMTFSKINDDIMKPIIKDLRNFIYSRVTKRTGMLGRSLFWEKSLSEGISVSFDFDWTKAPHKGTHVGDSETIITVKKRKFLTIPVGPLSNVYYNNVNNPRPSVLDYDSLKFRGRSWFDSDGTLMFTGKKSVVVANRINTEELKREASDSVGNIVNNIAKECVARILLK